MFQDCIYSFYEYVKSRILAAASNPTNTPKLVGGILNAQDWPPKNFAYDCFYLLIIGEAPIGSQGYSQYSPMIFHQIQWVWINRGTDTQPGTRQANRGDKYYIAQTMKGYLLNGLVPGYTQKLTWSMNSAGIFTGVATSTPNEPITWNPVTFHEKLDKASGLTYCAAALRVWDMTDAITA
jgi:hypothetical protein